MQMVLEVISQTLNITIGCTNTLHFYLEFEFKFSLMYC